MNNQSNLCYFYENSYNEPVSSLTYNRDYDILATSNGTRHFPNIITDDKIESSNSPQNVIDDKTEDNIDDPYVPSNFKMWKFKNC